MNVCSVFSTVFIFLVLSHVGRTVHGQDKQIYGGTNTKITEFPWFTAILDYRFGTFLCGGSLIGSRYVLTASHCVENIFDIEVEVGYWCQNRSNCGRKSDFLSVQQAFRHEGEAREKGGDMVLLELIRPVDLDVQPAVPYLGKLLHPGQIKLKRRVQMTMVGAGRAGTTGSFFVRKLEVSYFSPKKCNKRIQNPLLVTENVICSTVEKQEESPCEGDSGSALVVAGKGRFQSRDMIVALHNRGPRDCSNSPEDQVLLHFRMEDAAPLLQRVVCGGNYAEDWCGATTQGVCSADGPDTQLGKLEKLQTLPDDLHRELASNESMHLATTFAIMSFRRNVATTQMVANERNSLAMEITKAKGFDIQIKKLLKETEIPRRVLRYVKDFDFDAIPVAVTSKGVVDFYGLMFVRKNKDNTSLLWPVDCQLYDQLGPEDDFLRRGLLSYVNSGRSAIRQLQDSTCVKDRGCVFSAHETYNIALDTLSANREAQLAAANRDLARSESERLEAFVILASECATEQGEDWETNALFECVQTNAEPIIREFVARLTILQNSKLTDKIIFDNEVDRLEFDRAVSLASCCKAL